MPELPEVETIKLGLQKYPAGRGTYYCSQCQHWDWILEMGSGMSL